MALDYSTTNLLQSIRDVSNVGASVQDWPDSTLLRLLNRQVLEYLVPFIWKHREGHWDTYADQALASGTAAYPVPSKATALTVRAVQLVDASGNPYGPLREVSLEQAINFSGVAITVPQGTPTNYYWRGNSLVLWPVPADATLSLRIYYEARPSELVLNSACLQATALTGGTFRVTYVGTAPSGFVGGAAVDMVQNVPGFDVLATSTISGTGAQFFDITGTKPAALAIGDWLCLSGQAPVITGAVPEIAMGCLVDHVALKAFGSKMDAEAFARTGALLKSDESRAEDFFKRRNRGDHAVVGRGALHKFRRGTGGWSSW